MVLRGVAAAMLTQWLLFLAFALSDRLHHAVCDDSDQPTHDCALVSIAKGHLSLSAAVAEPVAPAFRELRLFPLLPDHLPVPIEGRVLADRGPPRFLLPT
jgi:hypothetical protein